MTEIVLNEKQWAEDAIQNASLGNKPAETLGRLARYYRELGYKKSEASKMLEEFIIRCDPAVNVIRWQPVIESSIKYAQQMKLIDIPPIIVTSKELAKIGELPGVLLQRLMFTLLCLAKYGNAVSPRNNSWVNCESRDIFALANIKVTIKRQALLFNDLWNAKYIGYSNIVDNVNVVVDIVDKDGRDAVMQIDDFRNLGNQYMQHIGDGYMSCGHCGAVIKRNSPNQKYCKACAVDVNIQKTMQNKALSAA